MIISGVGSSLLPNWQWRWWRLCSHTSKSCCFSSSIRSPIREGWLGIDREDFLLQSNNGLVLAEISELLKACEKCGLRWSDQTVMIVVNARLKPKGEETLHWGSLDFRISDLFNMAIVSEPPECSCLFSSLTSLFFLLFVWWFAASCNVFLCSSILLKAQCVRFSGIIAVKLHNWNVSCVPTVFENYAGWHTNTNGSI